MPVPEMTTKGGVCLGVLKMRLRTNEVLFKVMEEGLRLRD